MSDETMCWVAEDPTQPGSACAAIVDDGADLPHLYATLARWAKEGRIPQRVTRDKALVMLYRWCRVAEQLTLEES